jgi:hypothetical protein
MVELTIEHWKNADGSSHYLWSVWQDGKRIGMGGPIKTAADAEKQGRLWTRQNIDGLPDRVTHL